MLITRKIGKLFRGKATPTQLYLACILGSLIGFMPGFAQAPGMFVVLVLLLAVLNANLFLAATVGMLAKIVSLLIMPVTFAVGRVLIDGPTSGVAATLINAPVTALMGFEYYATTGGLITGSAFGVVVGAVAARMIGSFRKKMASLQEGSERYERWTSRRSVKVFMFIFVGGGKKDYKALMSKRVGNPIRPIGVIAAILIVVLMGVLYQFASGPIVTAALLRGLERANGATVDIRQAELDLRGGRLVLSGFAMADPNDLATDLFRADRLEADISGRDLLRKRIALDQVQFANASTGETRRIPGRRVGRLPEPKPQPEITRPEEKTLEEYIAQAEQWKERLAQVQRWLERMSGPEDVTETDPAQRRESLRERLERQVAEQGYANVRAAHRIEDAPTFMVYRLDAESVRAAKLDGATLDIRGRNLSTHPHLADEAPSLRVESSDDRLRAHVSLDHVVSATTASSLSFHYRRLDVDSVAGQLRAGRVIKGGTMDLHGSGTYGGESAGWIDLPLSIIMHNTEVSIAGSSRTVDELTVPIGVRGPLADPRITLDDTKLADALVQAGAAELANRLDAEVGSRIDKELERLDDKLPSGLGDTIREGAGRFIPRRD